MIEVNGPANIVTLIETYRFKFQPIMSREEDELFSKLEQEALKTIVYMKELENPKGIMWYDIKKENGNAK